MVPDNEPMLDTVDGDIGMSRHIANALDVIADRTLDSNLRDQLREISSGQGSIRDLVHNEGFVRLAETVVAPAIAELKSLTPEEMQRLVDQGNAVLERYRNQTADGPQQSEQDANNIPQSGSLRRDESPNPVGFGPPDLARDSQTLPGTRKPNRDRIVGPDDDPDEDDVYFQERNRKGWLL
ncbi:hypothetical protein [Nocardia goodfellowii]|uniref:Uncharacterized protein n=1 Tax=Nocardia goodfellowii TaxID=882446 RepID=A0ABS4QKL1_9NOCA|nr:hypothetical protein [Nocardia goodfellowii]MBP2192237.1 hypothetical protein [Nocardia goodfellowii]